MDRLEAFEKMLADIRSQAEYEAGELKRMEAEGRKKTALYRQYLGNRLMYKTMLDKYREYGLV